MQEQCNTKNYKTRLIMRQIIIIMIVFCWTTSSFGQKFMIKNGDTLFYKLEMVIADGDTSYLEACHTFEKVNGKIVNLSDDQYLRQGPWIITDSLGNYWIGIYHNGNEKGIWKFFDKSGKLLKETEKVSFGGDTYLVKEIDYINGQPIILIDKPFLAFYIKNLTAIMIIFFVAVFGRVFINSRIYNIENGTDYSPIYFYFPGFVSKNFEHSLRCSFTFWFFNYKPECRRLVIISNTMSAIALLIFFGIIIGLAVTGEILNN